MKKCFCCAMIPVLILLFYDFAEAQTKSFIGNPDVTVSKSALPDGAATSANQESVITSNLELNMVLQGKLSIVNSTIITLGIDEVFTGTSEDIIDYAAIEVIIKSDQVSAANGISMQWSPDGMNWDHTQLSTLTPPVPFTAQAMPEARYFRIVYTNGGVAQTYFRLQTIYKMVPSPGEVRQLGRGIDDRGDAQLVRAVIAAKRIVADDYVNVNATENGNLKISLEELESGISTNNNQQLKVTEYNSVGSELWDSAIHAGYSRITDGSTIASISENDLHVVIDQAINSGSNNIGAIELVDPDNDNRRGEFDTAFSVPVWIDVEHHELHEEDAYVAEAIDSIMGIDDTIIIAFKTPNTTKRIHLVIMSSIKGAGHVELIESPTWSTGTGSQLPVYNRERDSSNTTDLLEDTGGSFVDSNNMVLNPDSLSGGTVIPDGGLYSFGTAGQGGGTQNRGATETMLATNSTYAAVLTTDTATNAGQLKLRWYEHVSE